MTENKLVNSTVAAIMGDTNQSRWGRELESKLRAAHVVNTSIRLREEHRGGSLTHEAAVQLEAGILESGYRLTTPLSPVDKIL